MDKQPDAFRTIGEAAEDIGVPQHVLRFWETRFTQIKPTKRAGGRRFYRSGDIELLQAIKKLLYQDGYTIKGVQRLLKEKGGRALLVAAHGGQDAAQTQAEFAVSAGVFDDVPAGPLIVQVLATRPHIDLAAAIPAALPAGLAAGLAAALAEITACQKILRSARGA